MSREPVECGMLRGAVLAALTAVLTVAGHLAGGGTAPDLSVLVVLLPLAAGVFATVAERSRSGWGTLLVLGVGQLVLHRLIEVLAPVHVAHHAAPPGTSASAAWMLVMHVMATLLTAAALRFADRGSAAVAAVLRRVVPRRLSPLAADRPLATLVTPGPAVTLRLAAALASAHLRRGPPVGC